MTTIIDSLFLELGIDVSKFSADQQRAISKIQEFETRAKKAGKGSADAIKTVGDAFNDLARSSSIGAGAARIEDLSKKFTGLGKSLGVAGGVGAPLGLVTRGIGMMLSPAALGITALSMLGKATWDFNADMSAMNATLARNAELAGMSTSKLWAMGEAAKTTGGNPAAVVSGIDSLQTSLAGASIGVGDASAQMTGMARLAPYGAHYRKGGFGSGVNEESLFKAARNMYLQQGRAKTIALLTGYGLMSKDQADLAISPGGWQEYQKTLAKAKAMKTGGGFEAVVRKSLQSQVGLGEKDINAAITAETAYGGIQEPMQTMVGLLTQIYAVLNATLGYAAQIVQFLAHPITSTEQALQRVLEKFGISPKNARQTVTAEERAAKVGLALSSDPTLPIQWLGSQLGQHIVRGMRNKNPGNLKYAGQAGAIGKDAEGFAIFRTQEDGYAAMRRQIELDFRRGKKSISSIISSWAPNSENNTSAYITAVARRLGVGANKVLDPSMLNSLMNAMAFQESGAMQFASRALAVAGSRTVHTANDNRSNTSIGDVHITTSATNGRDFAKDFRKGLLAQPLLNSSAQQIAVLGMRGKVL